MKLILITGKSGSGKTFIAEKIATILNAKHINLDEISHKTLEMENVKSFVMSEFSIDVFDESGNIDRKNLGKKAFLNPESLQKLNNISEKEMEKLIDSEIKNCKQNYLILDYLLLPKMKYFKSATLKILVTSDIQNRKERIIKRDNISEEYFSVREQNSIEFNKKDYDIVIENNEKIDFEKLINTIKAG